MWESKVTHYFEPYTKEQYNVYLKICLENQYISDLDSNHYIDLGCLCKLCSNKRQELFQKAKNGLKIYFGLFLRNTEHVVQICHF